MQEGSSRDDGSEGSFWRQKRLEVRRTNKLATARTMNTHNCAEVRTHPRGGSSAAANSPRQTPDRGGMTVNAKGDIDARIRRRVQQSLDRASAPQRPDLRPTDKDWIVRDTPPVLGGACCRK